VWRPLHAVALEAAYSAPCASAGTLVSWENVVRARRKRESIGQYGPWSAENLRSTNLITLAGSGKVTVEDPLDAAAAATGQGR